MIESVWAEYDSAAEWCAKRGYNGKDGDPLPKNLSEEVNGLIQGDPEAFEARVKDFAYAIAMSRHQKRYPFSREWADEDRTQEGA